MATGYASYDQFLDDAYAKGWSDGFPVVPPEPELIDASLATLSIAPDTVVGEAAQRGVKVTARDVALHSVLAGCLPDYLPAVVAAVQAFFDGIEQRDAGLPGLADSAQCVILNGPVRKQLDVNCHLGAFGPGWRANATIGRALRLLIGSAFGARQAKYLGDPALYTFCFGEDEENSPWTPLHVERGFSPESSTATVHSVHLYMKPIDRKNTTGEGLLDAIAGFLRGKVSGVGFFPDRPASLALIFGDEFHRQFRIAGWSKQQMRDYLFPRLTAKAEGPFKPVQISRPEDMLIVAAGGLALASWWSFISFGTVPATRAIDPLRRRP
jgi:hypothetical protein